MLSVGPWKVLPLHILWLDEHKSPPDEMVISKFCCCFVIEIFNKNLYYNMWPLHNVSLLLFQEEYKPRIEYNRKPPSPVKTIPYVDQLCHFCSVQNMKLQRHIVCDIPPCFIVSHLTCMARHMTRETNYVIPLHSVCPQCKRSVPWKTFVASRISQ
jgi:hypothetical protein